MVTGKLLDTQTWHFRSEMKMIILSGNRMSLELEQFLKFSKSQMEHKGDMQESQLLVIVESEMVRV